jgi:DNA replication protein DnaD
MNGRVARELRRASEFKVHDRRDYHTFTITEKQSLIYTLDQDGEVSVTTKQVPRLLTECVSPGRKIYKHLKKFYNGFAESEAQFTTLPTEEELHEQFRKIKEDFRTTTGAGLPNENDGNVGEDN